MALDIGWPVMAERLECYVFSIYLFLSRWLTQLEQENKLQPKTNLKRKFLGLDLLGLDEVLVPGCPGLLKLVPESRLFAHDDVDLVLPAVGDLQDLVALGGCAREVGLQRLFLGLEAGKVKCVIPVHVKA